MVVVVWLAIVVYREMISPLQVQLVESRQLVERQEKLASLGMLAAGVAHEIRNPLTAIKAWLYLQQKHLKPGTPEIWRCRVDRRRNQPGWSASSMISSISRARPTRN